MANIASQKKRILRTAREHDENRRLVGAVKTHFGRLEQAVAQNDSSAVAQEYRALVSRIDKAVQKGALHARNAARKKARAARLAAGS
jgi:small subunit ribosomal protein S20